MKSLESYSRETLEKIHETPRGKFSPIEYLKDSTGQQSWLIQIVSKEIAEKEVYSKKKGDKNKVIYTKDILTIKVLTDFRSKEEKKSCLISVPYQKQATQLEIKPDDVARLIELKIS